MTLAELMSTTPVERWRSLSAAQQELIGSKVLEKVFADLVSEDDGTDASIEDRNEASEISNRALNELDDVVQAAFPVIVWADESGLRPAWQDYVREAMVTPGKILVKGLRGLRRVYSDRRCGWTIRLGGRDVEIGGFQEVDVEPGQPSKWVAWTVEQVDAERLRRHPELAPAAAITPTTVEADFVARCRASPEIARAAIAHARIAEAA